ncbi:MAG: chromate transporter [Clostridia bacterium]|nr:chromate transporter [Clostridia bacterium]
MTYLLLFWEFFKTGLFAVGGGMATIPFLYEMSDKFPHWFSHKDLANMIAVSESTPGPIGVNMATYVGFLTGGDLGTVAYSILGAVISTLGLVTPSIIVILIVTAILKSFKNNKYVKSAFYGLRPASTGLIASAGLSVLFANMFLDDKISLSAFNYKGLILAVILWIFTNIVKKTKGWHPIIFIGISAVVGMIFSM